MVLFIIATKVKSWLQKMISNMKWRSLYCCGYVAVSELLPPEVTWKSNWIVVVFKKNDQTCKMWRSWIMFKMSSRAAIQQVGVGTWLMCGIRHLKDEHVVVAEKKDNLREFSNWLLWQPLCTLPACLTKHANKITKTSSTVTLITRSSSYWSHPFFFKQPTFNMTCK